MKMQPRVLTVVLILGLSLSGCGHIPESQLGECRTQLAKQQQMIATYETQIEELTEAVSKNNGQILKLEDEHERITIELEELEASLTGTESVLKANVQMRFQPTSPKCDADTIAWTIVLSETSGIGVTFVESVNWYRTMWGPFGTGGSSQAYHNSTTDPEWLPVRVEPGSTARLDLGEHECFSEKRQYYYVMFGIDDYGDEVVASGTLIVDLWEPSE